MRYVKDNVITSSPSFKNVVNPNHEYIISQGWKVYEEPEPTPYEQAIQDWHQSNYNKRIKSNVNLLDPIYPSHDIYIKFYTYLKEKGFPIYSDGDIRYIYINEIDVNHQTFIDNDDNLIIEDKPKIEDYE